MATDQKRTQTIEVELHADESAFDQLAYQLYLEHEIPARTIRRELQKTSDRVLVDMMIDDAHYV